MSNPMLQKRVVPAPLLVIVCLGGAWLAHHLYPVRVLPDLGLAAPILATLVCAAALAIGLAGVRAFHRHQTPTSPFRPTTALVTSGVFSRTRNPMYLSFVLVTLGVAIAVNSLAFLLATGVLALLLHLAVIRPEERYLSATFGEAFESYRSRTRRWL